MPMWFVEWEEDDNASHENNASFLHKLNSHLGEIEQLSSSLAKVEVGSGTGWMVKKAVPCGEIGNCFNVRDERDIDVLHKVFGLI